MSSGDKTLGENYLQHADHFMRILEDKNKNRDQNKVETTNKSLPDQKSSLEPLELMEWIKKIRILEESFGSKNKFVTNSEEENITMKKILVIKPAKQGTVITKELLSAKRGDGKGILPLNNNLKKIIGKKLIKNINHERKFSWNLLKK